MLTSSSRRHIWNAIYALHAISQQPDGLAALADLDVFEELQQLGPGRPDETHRQVWKLRELLENIARYDAGKADSIHK
jgi:hypothetical protein